jgi:hypothetical protein
MGTNVPPMPAPAGAPQRKKTSPIVWILLILAGMFVFAIVAAVGLGYYAYHKAKQAGFDVSLLEKKPELAFLKMAVAANPDAELVSVDEGRGIARIKDKKTGKVITMNFEDIRKGRFTMEQEGKKVTLSAQAGAGQVKLPSWLPAYAGATPEGFSAEATGGSESGSTGGFGFKTSDSPDKVAAFYEEALKNAGFTVERTANPGGAILSAEAGTRKAVLHITAAGSGASVNGTFEEQ